MKYNRSQIMKNAWRTYKYVGKKQGKTFAEVLKATWRLERVSVQMAENAAKAEAERKARAEMFRNAKPAERGDYNGFISHTALYGSDFVNGGYVGD